MKSESTKKPYEAPKLFVYGDIREITQSNATGKKSDAGGKQPNKTS